MIKAVIFDIGGVLASQKIYDREFNRIVEKEFGIPKNDPRLSLFDELYDELMIGKISGREFFQKFSLKIEKPYPTSLDNYFYDFTSKFSFRPRVVRTVKILRSKGIKIGILSNIFNDISAVHYEKGFYSIFDYVILSHEIKLKKPDRKIFFHLLKVLNLKPNEVLFIDDFRKNIESAKELGIITIHFKTIPQFEEEMKRLGLI